MLLNIIKKDFLRKKVITIALLIFILLSSLLVTSSSNMIIELLGAIDELFAVSKVPHFIQMHTGELDQTIIDEWVIDNPLVDDQQTVEMLNIDSLNVYFGDSKTSEKNSVMDFNFVEQNESFDFLLNLDNQNISVNSGEVAVPIFFQQERGVQLGDIVIISTPAFELELIASDFVRDVQMNPAIVSSKRFVVNKSDYDSLKENIGTNISGQIEYLIEFRLTDENQLDMFVNEYQASTLPQQGPALDHNLLRVLNALTDGLVASIIILISILLIIVAMLCLRFTLLVTIEEDYTEIGVMKAIGIKSNQIRRIYLTKYVVLSSIASILGYLMSFLFGDRLISNITLYMGNVQKTFISYLIPLTLSLLVFFSIVVFCSFVLRRFNKISAIEALRSGSTGESGSSRVYLPLSKNKFLPVNIFLGIQDVIQRFRIFRVLFVVFCVSTFIIIVPSNFLNTIRSSAFITYMGVPQSEIRMDLQLSDNLEENFENALIYLDADQDIDQFLPLTTYQIKVINTEGGQENFNIEVGDFSQFPLEYVEGVAPSQADEISLSYLNASQLEKEIGDSLTLVLNGQEKSMVVSGIYQDITNGGLTAKATSLSIDSGTVLRYVILLNLKPDINLQDKVDEYTTALSSVKVTDISDYVTQTFGNVIKQIRLMTILSFILASTISVLVTSLFLQMLIAKDFSQIAVMKSMGFSSDNIRTQYVVKSLLILNFGIIIGTILSNTLGENLISVLLSFFGASSVRFVINPLQSYILYPLLLMAIVTFTTLVGSASIKAFNISEVIRE